MKDPPEAGGTGDQLSSTPNVRLWDFNLNCQPWGATERPLKSKQRQGPGVGLREKRGVWSQTAAPRPQASLGHRERHARFVPGTALGWRPWACSKHDQVHARQG